MLYVGEVASVSIFSVFCKKIVWGISSVYLSLIDRVLEVDIVRAHVYTHTRTHAQNNVLLCWR